MHIKEYKKLKFSESFIMYYSIDLKIKRPLAYIYLFFQDAYVYIKRQGVAEFLQEVDENSQEDEYVYELVSLSFDYVNKLVYLHDTQFDYCKDAKSSSLAKLLDELSPLQACQQNLIDYAVLTQENFHQLVDNWDSLYEETPIPFALLYQDDQGCYDVQSFQTEEKMQQFVNDHLQK